MLFRSVKNFKDFTFFKTLQHSALLILLFFLPSIASAVRIDLWHIKLDHPSDQKLYILNKTMPIVSCNNYEPCMVCPLAKQKKLPFPASQHVVDCAFALIHIDIWGPFSIPIVDGY